MEGKLTEVQRRAYHDPGEAVEKATGTPR